MPKVFAAFLTSLVLFAATAATASASVLTVPFISGSGSISGTPGCQAVDVPTGAVVQCPPFSSGASSVVLTAIPQPSPAGHWKFVSWSTCNGQAAGNTCTLTDNNPFPFQKAAIAVFEDKTGPTLTLPTVTYSTTDDRTVSISWGANEPLSEATCQIDGAASTACTATGTHTVTLPEGEHSIRVRGKDRSGNPSDLTPLVSFRILDTTLMSTPAASSNDKNPTFVFSSVTGARFDCRLDTAAFADCGAKSGDRASLQLTNLAEGTHTFRVRAKDGGELDRVPATFTWTVDTVAPTATFGASGPGEGALQAVNRETFVFSSTEEGTFECRLDGAAFTPCASGIALEGLAAGAHRFEVRAVDAAGNIGPAVARNWVIFAFPAAGPTPQANTPAEKIVVTLAFFATATKKTTKFTTLQVKNVPSGSTVKVTCAGKGCPSGLKGKGFSKTNAGGTVSLAKFIKKPLKTGDKITVTVSKPNAIAAVKVLTVRARKKPLIATKCVPPGAAKPAAC